MVEASEYSRDAIKQKVISVPRLKEVEFDAVSEKTEKRFGVQLRKLSEDGNEVFSVDISGRSKSVERAVNYLVSFIYPSSEHDYAYSLQLESVLGSHEFLDKLESQFGCVVIKLADRAVLKLCGNELDITLAISALENVAQAFYAEQQVRRLPTSRFDEQTGQISESLDVGERQNNSRTTNGVQPFVGNARFQSSTPFKTDSHRDFASRSADDQLNGRPSGDKETPAVYNEVAGMLLATSTNDANQFGGSDSPLDESIDSKMEDDELKRLRELAAVDFDEALRQLSELKGENFSEYAACADETKQVVFDWLLNRSESVDEWSRTIKSERMLADSREPGPRSPVDDDDVASGDTDSSSTSSSDTEESASASSPANCDKMDSAITEPVQEEACEPFPGTSNQPTAAGKKKALLKPNKKKKQKKNKEKELTKRSLVQRKKRDRKQEVSKSSGIVFAGVVGASEIANKSNPNINQSASFNPYSSYPNTSSDPDPLRPIIIDGNNVAREHGRVGRVYSSRGIRIAVDYFRQRGHQDIVVYVPQWRPFGYRFVPPTTEGRLLIDMHEEGILEYTPSRKNPLTGRLQASYDDWYIVNAAFLKDGVIVSNDQFRDVIANYPQFAETVDKRTLPFNFLGDTFILPPDPRGRYAPSLEDMLRKTAPGSSQSQNYNQSAPYQPVSNGFGASLPCTSTNMYGIPQPGPDSFRNGYRDTAYASFGRPSGPSVQQYPQASYDPSRTANTVMFQPQGHPPAIRRDLAFNPAFGFGSPGGYDLGLPPGASNQLRNAANEETGTGSSLATTKPKNVTARQAQSVVRKNDFAADSDEESKLIEQAIQRSRGDAGSPHQTEQPAIPSSGFGSGNALSSSEEGDYLDIRTSSSQAPLPLMDRSKKFLPR